jgi:hypothetical protein
VLINPFEVPAGEDEAFVAAWPKARDVLSAAPGYLRTALHQSLGPDPDFRFVNVGRYASAEAFRAAVGDPRFRTAAPVPYRPHPGLYRIAAT